MKQSRCTSGANSVAATEVSGTVSGTGRSFWTNKTEFDGIKVFQRNDSFDPNLVTTWREGGQVVSGSNLERMATGRAPIGTDGKSVNLHHMVQSNDSAIDLIYGAGIIGHIVPLLMGLNNMSTAVINEVKRVISTHSSIVNFGTSANAVNNDWVVKAEAALGRLLPDSYKWFLKTYAGGEIGGEEIYSLYGMPFESVNGGDIVFQHLSNHKAGLFGDSKLVVSETDLGEIFFFDYDQWSDGEAPIYLRLPSGESVHYANDFYDFLCKRVIVHSS